MRKLLANFITLCLLLCMFTVPLMAYTYAPITTEIAVECTNLGGTFEIRAATENAPMPEKNQITVKDKSVGKFSIDYSEPAEYTYVIEQVKGQNKNIEQDATVYNLHVIVYSTEKETLNVVVNITTSGSDKKVDKISFTNTEKPVSTTETTTQQTTTTTTQTTSTTETHETGDFVKSNYGYMFLIAASCLMVVVLAKRKKGEGDKDE